MIVYLWDAGRWCGITGNLEEAQSAAAERMNDTAWVEEARPAYALRDLVRVYERTGRVWTAQPDRTWAMSERPAPAKTVNEARPVPRLARVRFRSAARHRIPAPVA
jgi:hypothetical protein